MTDSDYLTRRAAQEREAVEQAVSAAAREAHLMLAQEYEKQMGASGGGPQAYRRRRTALPWGNTSEDSRTA